MIMTQIHEIWKQLNFVSDCSSLTDDQLKTILPILKEEATARETKRIRYLLARSGIKRVKRLEEFDWKFNPQLPRSEIMAAAETLWNIDIKNVVLIGPSGVGKSHLASAICYKALQRSNSTVFISCFDLVHKLKRAVNKHAMMEYYSTVRLLCLDELGYVFPAPEQANDIFQIISKRSELASTIVTTNLIPSQWGKIFEAATATAILDRLSLNGYFIKCEGRSYRGKK
jgi:DNA replication protein DnaC